MPDTLGRHFDDKMLYKMCHRFRLTKRDDIFASFLTTFEASHVFYATNAQPNLTKLSQLVLICETLCSYLGSISSTFYEQLFNQ